METKRTKTPFPTSGYFGPQYFCDREKETQILKSNIKGNQSTTLVSIRRMGKTGLIKNLQHLMSDEIICIYADILPTENSVDLVNTLASAILNSISNTDKLGTRIWNFIKSLRPVISYDNLSGQPNVSFNIEARETVTHIDALLSFLENQNKTILFAIDEFQQILNYPETNTDAWLRKIIQQLNNVNFIFSGSQHHLMHEIFSNPGRPFFRSTSFLQLDKIEFSVYQEFILTKFRENKKEISPEVATEMLNWANVHTYYVQLICNRVFINSEKIITSDTWKQEALKILDEQKIIFYGYRDLLTKQQWKLLKAIASEQEVYSPTSKEFIMDYKLGSPATVMRSLEALQKKELIYSYYSSTGKLFYSIYDVLFQRWIQKN
ncbi:MAG: hypothetical protein V2I31_14610 [Mariniphaga sp.]|jgi:hypothetical protein|nr:hypothetical protein [Mariniphaga sp.]